MSLKKVEDASIEAFCVIEDDLWFVPRNINMLCKTNLKTGKTEQILFFEEEERLEIHLFVKIFFDGTNLWFVPNNAKNIYSFNISNYVLEKYLLPAGLAGIRDKFSYAYYDEQNIWAFPLKYSTGLKIDVRQKKIIELNNLYPANYTGKWVYTQIVKQGQYIYGICFEKLLVKYDCFMGKIEYIELPKVQGGYYAIAWYEDKIYAFGAEDASVTICSTELKILDVKLLVDKKIKCEALDYIMDGKAMIISYCPNILVRWELANNKVKVYQYEKLVEIKERAMLGEGGIGRFFVYDSDVFLTPVDYAGVKHLNKQLSIVDTLPVKLELMQEMLWGKTICIYENRDGDFIDRKKGTLKMFLEYITR